jgi:hypothetical protein
MPMVSSFNTPLAPRVSPVPRVRDARSDCLKGLAIVGVVAIHSGFPYTGFFRVGVLLFAAIWAFNFETGLARRKPDEVWPYVFRRCLRLLVPYLFWTALYTALIHSTTDWSTTPLHTIIAGWLGGYGWSGQYFLVVLFQLTLLFPLFRSIITPNTLWPIVLAGVALNTATYLFASGNPIVIGIGERPFVYWLPYVALGVAFARGYPRLLPALGIIAVVPLLAATINWGEIPSSVGGHLAPSITLGATLLLLAFGPRAGQPAPMVPPWLQHSLGAGIAYLGRNTFAIFVGHILILLAAQRAGLVAPDDPFRKVLFGILLIGSAITGSLALAWSLKRLKLGILIGA